MHSFRQGSSPLHRTEQPHSPQSLMPRMTALKEEAEGYASGSHTVTSVFTAEMRFCG